MSLLAGEGVSAAMLAAVFLSNLLESMAFQCSALAKRLAEEHDDRNDQREHPGEPRNRAPDADRWVAAQRSVSSAPMSRYTATKVPSRDRPESEIRRARPSAKATHPRTRKT